MEKIPEWFWDEATDANIHESGKGWLYPTEDDVRELKNVICCARRELELQIYLKEKPQLFMTYMRSGHGNWVFDRPSFGGIYIPDFLLAEGHSGGLSWTYVELESPKHTPYLRDGSFSQPLRIAIDQVHDWRGWAANNLNLIRNPKSSDGLGLFDFQSQAKAIIIIGRRSNYPKRYLDLRVNLKQKENIEVMPWDRFVDHANACLNHMGNGKIIIDYTNIE